MKRTIFTHLFILAALIMFGQAKKPILMVVPSDNYCMQHGYSILVNINGENRLLPDYRKASLHQVLSGVWRCRFL